MIKQSEVPQIVSDLYTLPNPVYYELIKLGKNPRFHTKTKSICSGGQLPPGAAFWSAKSGKVLDRGDCMKKGGLIYPSSTLEMRGYQKNPTEIACSVRAAVIEAPTGSGKTACAAKIIKESGQKTLILCHSIELMLQMAKEIHSFLGVYPALFYGKKKELGDITICTFMSAKGRIKEFSDYGFDLLIVDEADMFTTDSAIKFLCEFKCKRAFGFTATLNVEKYDVNMSREIRLMERLWGLVIKVKTDMQTDILEKICFRDYEKTYYDKYEIEIPSKEWALFRRHLDEDFERKKAQAKFVTGTVDKGDFAIVLLDRIADVDWHQNEIGFLSSLDVYKLHGSMSDSKRKDTVKSFKKNGGILVANVKIAGRGFDIPEANKAFIFCPLKGETPIRQAVGRVLRWIPDKKSQLFDWVDSSLQGQTKKRIKIYKEFYPHAEIITNY